MAYNSMNDETTVVALIDKNTRGDKIRIAKIRNKNTGSESVDIRVMYTPEGSTEVKPTQRGVRFNMEMLGEITEALNSLIIEDTEDD